ncbi:MAG: hypothetical protein QM783_12500 [Phycisphaerales bacterium]
MIQCLETWLAADPTSLAKHYGDGFVIDELDNKKFKKWSGLEATPKSEVQKSINRATANCKVPYRHAHGNQIIGKVSRDTLKARGLSAVTRLFRELEQAVSEYTK